MFCFQKLILRIISMQVVLISSTHEMVQLNDLTNIIYTYY